MAGIAPWLRLRSEVYALAGRNPPQPRPQTESELASPDAIPACLPDHGFRPASETDSVVSPHLPTLSSGPNEV